MAVATANFEKVVNRIAQEGYPIAVARQAVIDGYDMAVTYFQTHPEVQMVGDAEAYVLRTLLNAAKSKLLVQPSARLNSNPRSLRSLVRRGRQNPTRRHARRNSSDDDEDIRPTLVEMEPLTFNQIAPLARRLLEKNISVLVRGSPGIGKSQLAAKLADEMKLPMIDIRISQVEPQELGGSFYPLWAKDQALQAGQIDEKKDLDAHIERYNRLGRIPPEWLIRASLKPHFVFLDEINAAISEEQQAVAYQLVLDRQLGDIKLHPKTVVMAAGNLKKDGSIVKDLSLALGNRFAHFVMKIDVDEWMDWAKGEVDPLVYDYFADLRGKRLTAEGNPTPVPDPCSKALFNPRGHASGKGSDPSERVREVAWPSPRAWAMVSRIISSIPEDERDAALLRKFVTACVGKNAALPFIAWYSASRLYNAREVFIEGVPVNWNRQELQLPVNRTSLIKALGRSLQQQVNDTNIAGNVVKFIMSIPGDDLPSEEQVTLFLREFWDPTSPLGQALMSASRLRPVFDSIAKPTALLFQTFQRANPNPRRHRRR